MNLKKKLKSFTLAEILIAILILGIVVAITIPSLQNLLREYSLNVKRKAFYSRTTQAISFIADIKAFNSAYDFVNNQYRDIVKMDRVCGTAEIPIWGCNLPRDIFLNNNDGTSIKMPANWLALNPNVVNLEYTDENTGETYTYSQANSSSAAFITDNGESVNLFYNPKCSTVDEYDTSGFFAGKYACINMIFDVNGGEAPPNKVGKDIGIVTVFNPIAPEVVSPYVTEEDLGPASHQGVKGMCKAQKVGKRIPTWPEMAAMYINSKLYGLDNSSASGYWTASMIGQDSAYSMHPVTGFFSKTNKNATLNVRCVD